MTDTPTPARRPSGRDARRAQRAGPLPDHLRPVKPGMESGRYQPLSPDDVQKIHRTALRLLSEVGLSARTTHRSGEISGGEQQRVAICRALVMEPSVLLADEPTGNLDSATGASILDVLVHLRSESGTTLVLVTHDPAVASLADRRIHLRDGRIDRDERSS